MGKLISGFSKLSKLEKIDWLLNNHLINIPNAKSILRQYWNADKALQELHDEFIENTITNFYLPLGIAPNFSINNKIYTIPMAIEESSVVAAASKAAKFWSTKGGFKAEVIGTVKIGQIHFTFSGPGLELKTFIEKIKPKLISNAAPLTKNMKQRGGGILAVELIDKTDALQNYFQLQLSFDTKDAMGANFINSCLESFAATLKEKAKEYVPFKSKDYDIDIIMSILSNYVPECRVRASVKCPISELGINGIKGMDFAKKFVQAVQIAKLEPYRAVTHNKGIMNGVDAVVIATGNDFRAVEAGIHAYASRNGKYTSLSEAKIENNQFHFWLELPLALGTVGGLTNLHPLVKLSHQILGNPSAEELMQIVAVAGLAQNFAALKSLTTTGIQQGHMKMHLMNILNQFKASEKEKENLINHFKNNTVSYSAVEEMLKKYRA